MPASTAAFGGELSRWAAHRRRVLWWRRCLHGHKCGAVPPRAVVIPGTRPKAFPAGTYQVPCALIIGERKASTDRKTSLNDVLREHDLAV